MNRLHPQLALAPTQHPLSSSESVTTDDLNTDDEPMQMAAAQTETQLTCHPLVSSDDIIDAVPEIAGVGRELFAATVKVDSLLP